MAVTEVKTVNPENIQELLKQIVTGRVSEHLGLFRVKGALEELHDKEYAGYRYGQVRSLFSPNASLSIKMPTDMAKGIEHLTGEPMVFEGTLSIDAYRGTLRPVLLVSDIELVDEDSLTFSERISAMLADARYIRMPKGVPNKAKSSSVFRNPELLILLQMLRGEKTRVLLVFGTTAVTDKDVLQSLGTAKKWLDLRIENMPMGKPEDVLEVMRFLKDQTEYHIVGVVRGGGSGLEVFNYAEAVQMASEIPACFVVAVGHATDRVALELVADAAYATPTDLGATWNRLVEQAEPFLQHIRCGQESRAEQELAERGREVQQLKEQIAEYEKNVEELQKTVARLKGVCHEQQEYIRYLEARVNKPDEDEKERPITVVVSKPRRGVFATGLLLGALLGTVLGFAVGMLVCTHPHSILRVLSEATRILRLH